MTDLAKLRELLEKATKGPWTLLPAEEGKDYMRLRGTAPGHKYKIANIHDANYPNPVSRDVTEAQANAELIAALRNEAPALLDEVEALRTKLSEAEHMRDRHANAAKALNEDVTALEEDRDAHEYAATLTKHYYDKEVERNGVLDAALKALLNQTSNIEVLGEWEALDINFNMRKKVRAKVDSAIAVARQALGSAK